MKKKKKLFWFLLPSYWILTAVAIVAIAIYVFQAMANLYEQTLETDIKTRALLLADRISPLLDRNDEAHINQLCQQQGEKTSTRFTIVLPDGRVIGDSNALPSEMENHGKRLEVQQALAGEPGKARRTSQTLESELLYVAVPLFDTNGTIRCAVRASLPITAIREQLRPMTTRVIMATLITGLIAMFVCIVVVRRITRPLQTMSQAALKFAEGELNHRVPQQDADELQHLSESLNRMSSQLSDTLSTINEQRNEQNAVLSSMDEGVLAIDANNRIIHANRVAGDILGINHREVKKASINDIINNAEIIDFMTQVTEDQQRRTRELEYEQGERTKIIQASGRALWNSTDDSIGALIVMRDVTHLRHLEKVKTDFVANVSHELKTPITAIQGFVETLLSDEWKHTKAARRFLEIIRQQSGRLNNIVDDLLTLSRLEQADTNIIRKPNRILKVVENAIKIVQLQASDKKIKVETDIPKKLEWSINAPLIEQAMVNLLSNAVKYSDPGKKIVIQVVEEQNQLFISVIDKGYGMDQKNLDRLFERFYRVDSGRSSKQGGTGLGLSIVKHIVQTHQGIIKVESEEGVGSTFQIMLPALREEPADQQDSPE
ncbi:MAG: HAMP domain-containing histidine kinase [Kiritimatiellaceae bacterium]|nr:MAG: HAMP domain-containing histidine kinase [Kiritimatiellaceae bacterium]